ncbi:MAG: cadmium-translocating P-type ATPase [Bauldia sp.]|uniref:heavy metal translocating P-type ATPase n=1 Tax=Bauldia sp. TaxID=2575872 RepID=UPI001DA21C8F|nr:heavy metal translocating P-type ATPase [Bauldia sp.]MCB1497044.1 cadmium-translocating P-type ATPase [Bauldia sp.]
MAGNGFDHLSRQVLVAIPAIGLAAGGTTYFAGAGAAAHVVWAVATLPVVAALAVEIVTSLRRGEVGLDIVALLAMVSALLLDEALAGVVVALMYAGGQFLESYAAGRARREMTALLERVPKTAMRYTPRGLEEAPIDGIGAGDRVLVRAGEVVPADGSVAAGSAVLDQSALTGEPMPATIRAGEPVMSGSTNAGMAFDLTVSRSAAESTYAGIVRLVEAAEREKAPMVRLADRYAIVFLAVTVAIAGGAWIVSADPVRWLAVMVVATPCPLILAVPVAIIAGVSRAASRGVLVKGGGAMEVLAEVRTMVVDKTGTLTHGHASLAAIHPVHDVDPTELLRLAASLDQASGHVMGQALVAAATERGLTLSPPTEVREAQGSGLQGWVDGREIAVGSFSYVRDRSRDGADFGTIGRQDGEVTIAIAIDGVMAGLIVMKDEIRPEVPEALVSFRNLGVHRIVLASGDRADVTAAVAKRLDVDAALGEMTPESKVMAVVGERENGPVMMVGDGANDAPALAAADIGIAMGAHGAVASAQAADAILLVDRIDRIAEAMRIAQRSRRIALQSVTVGIGLSVIAMIVAAFGYLPPVEGALLQEAIDVAVILNALRALRG